MKLQSAFAGISLGLLIGLLVGLSISEVTGIILGSLTSMLAAFFGFTNIASTESKEIVIASFGTSAVLGILAGIYMRTHDFLGSNIDDEINSVKSVSFTEQEKKQIVLAKKFGILIEYNESSLEDSVFQIVGEYQDQTSKSILISGTAEDEVIPICDCYEEMLLIDIMSQFSHQGKDFQDLAQLIDSKELNDQEKKEILIKIKSILCQD